MKGGEKGRGAGRNRGNLPRGHPCHALQTPKKPGKTGRSAEEIECEIGKLGDRENRRCCNTSSIKAVNCRDNVPCPGSGIRPRYTVPNRRPCRSWTETVAVAPSRYTTPPPPRAPAGRGRRRSPSLLPDNTPRHGSAASARHDPRPALACGRLARRAPAPATSEPEPPRRRGGGAPSPPTRRPRALAKVR